MKGYASASMRTSTGAEETVVVTVHGPDLKPLARAVMTTEQFGRMLAGNEIVECDVEGKT